MKNKIDYNDDFKEMLMKMAEGNPGALTVLLELYKNEAAIDPDSALGGIGTMLSLDGMGIYGSHIWILFKDICGENLTNLIAVSRAHQLGLLSEDDIKTAIESRLPSFSPADLITAIKLELPDFGK